jgi:hypothetical protein
VGEVVAVEFTGRWLRQQPVFALTVRYEGREVRFRYGLAAAAGAGASLAAAIVLRAWLGLTGDLAWWTTASLALTVAALALLAAPAARADGLTLSTGFDYTTGKYTGTEKTEILYVPFIGKYELGRWTLKATVPYLRITGPGNVVGGGEDVVTLPGATVPRRTESGLGDIVTSAFYNVLNERTAPIGIDVGVKVKLATADDTRGLGTGRNDYSLQVDAFKPLGAVTLFGSLGHRWYGDPPGIDLKNVFYGSLGVAHRFSSATSAGLAYDYRPAITDGGGKVSELTAFATRRLSGHWKVQPYFVVGFAEASPDWGAGAQVAYSY